MKYSDVLIYGTQIMHKIDINQFILGKNNVWIKSKSVFLKINQICIVKKLSR